MSSPDPYLDLTTGILHNRLGITDPTELGRAEAELTSLRLIELRRDALPGAYDLAHLQGSPPLHLPRPLSVGRPDPHRVHRQRALFCLPQHIESFAAEVFGRLAGNDYLRGLDRERFVDHLADLLGDINALHPFREGNGRTQRAFLSQLARDAGYTLRWRAIDATENIEASKAAHHGDNRRLRSMLDQLTTPRPGPPSPRTPSDSVE